MKFEVHTILSDDLQILKEENLNESQCIVYSKGGDFLIVNDRNHIYIFETVYYEFVHDLDCQGGSICELQFADDDLHIISSCMTGHIIVWNFREPKTHGNGKNNSAFATLCEPQVFKNFGFMINKDDKQLPKSIFVGSTKEKYLAIYKEDHEKEITKDKWDLVAEFPVQDVEITCIVVSHALKCCFLGTSKGTVRVSVWPLW